MHKNGKAPVDHSRPFLFHGVPLPLQSGNQRVGDCPFCGKEGHFYVNISDSRWDCKVCSVSGNATTFVRQFHQLCKEYDLGDELSALAAGRKVEVSTLLKWGVVLSVLTGEPLVPGYNLEGKVAQLSRYAKGQNEKVTLWATPELGMFLHNLPNYDAAKENVYLCEGCWDGMALEEALSSVYRDEKTDRLVLTGNPLHSLLTNANIVATPSANVFRAEWFPLFSGKKLHLCYDNDHPRQNPKTKAFVPGAGVTGMRRVAELLARCEEPPLSIHYLEWGPEGYNPSLPDGYDVRDHLTNPATPTARVEALESLLTLLKPIPDVWVPHRSAAAKEAGTLELAPVPCHNWLTLINAWKKAMKWTPDLNRALSVMLAAAVSTDYKKCDQIWIRLLGPPSTGKSTLCEALAVAKKYVEAKSVITGFHSGYKSDKHGDEDHSLIPHIKDKTLIIKDGDTLMKSPNRDQILAEIRDLYDKASRVHYRHGLIRNYEDVHMTFILAGTPEIRGRDASELGARFLDCEIMKEIDPELEDEIGERIGNRRLKDMGVMLSSTEDETESSAMLKAKQLTAGYLTYLRTNSKELIKKVSVTEAQMKKCVAFGKFVSYMRARPSKEQNEVVTREFSARLVDQHVGLMVCLAIVLNRWTVDEKVLEGVRKVAMDTATGRVLELTKHLYRTGQDGSERKPLSIWLGETEQSTGILLNFLRRIHVVERFEPTGRGRPLARYRLTERLANLYRLTTGEGAEVEEDA